jgi:hypothetical protein
LKMNHLATPVWEPGWPKCFVNKMAKCPLKLTQKDAKPIMHPIFKFYDYVICYLQNYRCAAMRDQGKRGWVGAVSLQRPRKLMNFTTYFLQNIGGLYFLTADSH